MGMLNDLLLNPISAVSEFTAKSAGFIAKADVSISLNQLLYPVVGCAGSNTIGLPEEG